jgi:CDP-diacylglycerol---serine O-phosphatidyltransferase
VKQLSQSIKQIKTKNIRKIKNIKQKNIDKIKTIKKKNIKNIKKIKENIKNLNSITIQFKKRIKLDDLNFLKLVKLADFITWANAGCGLLAMLFAFENLFTAAAIFLLVAVFFDFLDGKIARLSKKKRTNSMGEELDSLADTVSFGVAPIVFIFFYLQPQHWYYYFIYIIFLSAGIFRLARFNTFPLEKYVGLPITISGLLIPLLYFIGVPPLIFPVVLLVLSILMIASFKFTRPF